MPDQYGPYRHFKRNLETLKQELDKEEKIQAVSIKRFNGITDALNSERIKSLKNSIAIMER